MAEVLDGPGIRGLARRLHLDPGYVSRVIRGERRSPHTMAAILLELGREELVLMELQQATNALNEAIVGHQQGRVSTRQLLAAIKEQQESAERARAVLERQLKGGEPIHAGRSAI